MPRGRLDKTPHGADNRTRTRDALSTKQALYQLSYTGGCACAGCPTAQGLKEGVPAIPDGDGREYRSRTDHGRLSP